MISDQCFGVGVGRDRGSVSYVYVSAVETRTHIRAG